MASQTNYHNIYFYLGNTRDSILLSAQKIKGDQFLLFLLYCICIHSFISAEQPNEHWKLRKLPFPLHFLSPYQPVLVKYGIFKLANIEK